MYNTGRVFGEEFIMIESDVYFEPYHYTFKVLKSLTEDTFPLANYIVNIEVGFLFLSCFFYGLSEEIYYLEKSVQITSVLP